jgi:hypothetical protein
MIDARVFIAAQLLGAPVVLAAAIAATRGESRRMLLAIAGAALVMLFAAVVYYDLAIGLRSEIAYIQSQTPGQGINQINYVFLVLGVGNTLNLAASALGMSRAARLGDWGWFAAMLLALVLAGVAGALFALQLIIYVAPYDFSARLARGDPAVSTPYFLLASLLTVVPPLVPLLFALRRDRPASAATAAVGAA